MYDLHQPLAFGGNVDPSAADPTWPLRLARAIHAAGLEYIGIQDHPYNASFLDTWTLLATLTQATQRVRFFPNVANLPLRRLRQFEPYAGEVVPGVRAAVAKARRGG